MSLNLNKTEVFLVKKSVIVIIILIIISLFIFSFNRAIISGLALGYIVSLLRLRVLSITVSTLVESAVEQTKKRFPFSYIFIQFFTIIVLILAVTKSTAFFLATFIGILIIQITILINSLCELIGITRNNFEQKGDKYD